MKRNDQLYTSKSNRRGVIILLVLLLIIVFLPRIVLNLFPESEPVVTTEELRLSRELKERDKIRKSSFNNHRKKNKEYRKPPQSFDPNTYSKDQWMYLGLSEKQANVVLRFSEKGIRNKEDFQRIFVIPEELMYLIIDSLRFENGTSSNFKQANREIKKIKDVVEINKATREQLIELPGIGEYVADRIISYRMRLGGFYRKEQLLEIKKIDVELYSKLEGLVSVNSAEINKININLADAAALKGHPYLNWNIANSIVKMRNQRGGSFKTLEELLDSVLIDRELFEKLKPYLSL